MSDADKKKTFTFTEQELIEFVTRLSAASHSDYRKIEDIFPEEDYQQWYTVYYQQVCRFDSIKRARCDFCTHWKDNANKCDLNVKGACSQFCKRI